MEWGWWMMIMMEDRNSLEIRIRVESRIVAVFCGATIKFGFCLRV